MYFHNVATHRHPRVSSTAKPSWEPFHLQSVFRAPAPVHEVDPSQYLQELRQGSEPLPRGPRGRSDIVFFQLPSSATDADIQYVPSWPPTLPASISSPSSASSTPSSPASASLSVYFTPPTTPIIVGSPTTIPPTDDAPTLLGSSQEAKIGAGPDPADSENRPPWVQSKLLRVNAPLYRPAGLKRRSIPARNPSGLKGWARLRRNAPPALRIEQNNAAAAHNYVLEFCDEDGLAKPHPQLALLRREITEEQRSRLLALLVRGSC
ncbi:hypothetical protein B0H11DRAFT_2290353 [Mycena galericulata]|nr:hypothetical protein B0H11DRAFT_2290353 [Mycena galericulata]